MNRVGAGSRVAGWRLPVGLGIVAVIGCAAALSLVWTPVGLDMAGPTLAWPDGSFWLGTDAEGRDLLSLLMGATGTSLFIAGFSTLVAALAGVAAGTSLAVFAGPVRVGASSMLLLAPILVIAMLLVALGVAGPGASLLAIALVGTVQLARGTAADLARLLDSDPVAAARVAGLPPLMAVQRHVLPRLLPRLAARTLRFLAVALAAEALLAAVSLGMAAPGTSLGLLLREAQNFAQLNPLPAIAPTVTLLLLLIAIELAASGLASEEGDV